MYLWHTGTVFKWLHVSNIFRHLVGSDWIHKMSLQSSTLPSWAGVAVNTARIRKIASRLNLGVFWKRYKMDCDYCGSWIGNHMHCIEPCYFPMILMSFKAFKRGQAKFRGGLPTYDQTIWPAPTTFRTLSQLWKRQVFRDCA